MHLYAKAFHAGNSVSNSVTVVGISPHVGDNTVVMLTLFLDFIDNFPFNVRLVNLTGKPQTFGKSLDFLLMESKDSLP